MNIQPFHIAIPVYDLEAARKFYREVLDCPEGRSDTLWTDFNLYGHQLVIHYKPKLAYAPQLHHNPVDGHDVPIPHYGVVLEWDTWHELEVKLRKHDIQFVIEPGIRFKGKPGEQATMFFLDPSGNALEFKAFKDIGQLFATESSIPNSETVAAMDELKDGKGKKFNDVDDLFKSI